MSSQMVQRNFFMKAEGIYKCFKNHFTQLVKSSPGAPSISINICFFIITIFFFFFPKSCKHASS